MLNNISIMGRITKDLEIKYTPNNNAVLSFSIACERDYVQKGQERQTDFIDCVAWNHAAQFLSKYFTKGDLVILTGSLQKRKWQDQNGNNRFVTEVIVSSVNFGGSKKEKDQQPAQQTPPAPATPPMPDVPPIPPMPETDAFAEVQEENALPFDIVGY